MLISTSPVQRTPSVFYYLLIYFISTYHYYYYYYYYYYCVYINTVETPVLEKHD